MTRPGEERPIYLTDVGRRQLENRLSEYVAQRARLTARSTDPTDVQDSVEASGRLPKRQVLNLLHEADHVSALVAAIADPLS